MFTTKIAAAFTSTVQKLEEKFPAIKKATEYLKIHTAALTALKLLGVLFLSAGIGFFFGAPYGIGTSCAIVAIFTALIVFPLSLLRTKETNN